jgi:transposase
MTDEALPEAEQDLASRLLAQLPGLAGCIAAAKRLNALLRRKSAETLEKVLADAGDTALKEFVASLRRDLGAVQAALDLPWTTSPAEGQINSNTSRLMCRPFWRSRAWRWIGSARVRR